MNPELTKIESENNVILPTPQDIFDIKPDQIDVKTGAVIIKTGDGLIQYGSGLSIVGKNLQSTNYKEGSGEGWQLSSNGEIIGFSKHFGDGSDGDVTITGTTTLTRDMYYDNLIINPGGILQPSGYRVYAKTSITIKDTGISRNNGGNAGNGSSGSGITQGTGGTAGAAAASGIFPTIAGKAGGEGGTDTNPGGAGGAGGTAGTIVAAVSSPRALPQATSFGDWSSGTLTIYGGNGGSGGSGGGGGGGHFGTGGSFSCWG